MSSSTLPGLLAVLCTIWGIVGPLSQLVQLRRMLRFRSAHDVSVGSLCAFLIGYLLWLAYGVVLKSTPLIVADAVGAGVSLATVLAACAMRAQARALAKSPPRRRRTDPPPAVHLAPRRRRDDWQVRQVPVPAPVPAPERERERAHFDS